MPQMRSIDTLSGELRYHHKGTVNAATGDPVYLPGTPVKASVAVNPGSGATVEYTLSHPDDVAAGNAVWFTTSISGATSKTNIELPLMATAVRMTATTDASDWEVLA